MSTKQMPSNQIPNNITQVLYKFPKAKTNTEVSFEYDEKSKWNTPIKIQAVGWELFSGSVLWSTQEGIMGSMKDHVMWGAWFLMVSRRH